MNQDSNLRPVYSVVAPVYNEAEGLSKFYSRVVKTMDTLSEPWELVLVNDGSRDNSLEVMLDLHKQDSRVKLVSFARNFGHQIAVTAGMDYARGDAVIIIDSDLQDPPETILPMIDQWKQGYQVVYAIRNQRPGET
ncbi:MAG TPA: glycosyltransferase family 2 protein, partial [Aggregatilineales bacterium]|nr:glycosyltransferase family 2 protein [Aggregatilineales bacterium]